MEHEEHHWENEVGAVSPDETTPTFIPTQKESELLPPCADGDCECLKHRRKQPCEDCLNGN